MTVQELIEKLKTVKTDGQSEIFIALENEEGDVTVGSLRSVKGIMTDESSVLIFGSANA
jgi:hypothetical protein